jgi:hypothetical protein
MVLQEDATPRLTLRPPSGIQSVLAPSVQATAVARDAPWGEVKGVFYDHHIPEVLRRLLKDTVPRI